MSDSDSRNEQRFPYNVPLSSQETCNIVIEAQDRHNPAPPNRRTTISIRANNGIERRRERQRRYRERNQGVIRERNRNYYCQKRKNAQTTVSDSGFDNVEAITDDEILNDREAHKKKLRRERDRRYRKEHGETLKQRNKDYRQRKKNAQQGSEGIQVPNRQAQEEREGPFLNDPMERSHQNTDEGPSTNAEEVPNSDVDEPSSFDAYSNYIRDKFAHKFFVENLKNNQLDHTYEPTEAQQEQHTPINSPKGGCNPDDDLFESFKVLKDASTSTSVYDEASIFGEYIATKIRQMDPITALTVQHHIRNIIYLAESGIYSQQDASVIKKESVADESNFIAALCPGEKQETNTVNLMALDRQIRTQDASPVVGVYEVNIEQGGAIKAETDETDMDIGPTVLQPVDSCYRIDQQKINVVKQENMIIGEGNKPGPCGRVEEECVEGGSGDSIQQSRSTNSGVENTVIMHPAVSKPQTEVGTSTQQHDIVGIKKEVIEIELEPDLATVEYVDCEYRPYKEEPPIS